MVFETIISGSNYRKFATRIQTLWSHPCTRAYLSGKNIAPNRTTAHKWCTQNCDVVSGLAWLYFVQFHCVWWGKMWRNFNSHYNFETTKKNVYLHLFSVIVMINQKLNMYCNVRANFIYTMIMIFFLFFINILWKIIRLHCALAQI